MTTESLARTLARAGATFDRRVVRIGAGQTLPYRPTDWLSCLVVVVRGEVELITASGARALFAAGSVLALSGVPLLGLRSAAACDAVLLAVSKNYWHHCVLK